MMKIVGLTGGIGSGKSVVAAMFREMGAATIDTDQLSRDVVAPGSEGLQEIVKQFGNDVLSNKGSLDRQKLRDLVFNSPSSRLVLESIVHPRIYFALQDWVQKQIEAGTSLGIIEIPLLFESPAPFSLDATVCVVASRAQQIDRSMKRSNYDAKTLEGILAAQMDPVEKAKRADYVIDNSGSLEATKKQVADVFSRIIK